MRFHIRKAVAGLLLIALVFGTIPIPAAAVTASNVPASEADTGQAETQSRSGLVQLMNGSYVPYDEPGGETKAPPANTITYKDIFNAHSSDLTSGYNYVKAGGAFTATTYGAGDTAWWPLSTSDCSKELSYDGSHYVCTGYMFANHGPNSYAYTELAGDGTYLALPIRPSQEDGYDGTYSTANYVRAAGVPSYKLEILRSKQIPAYSQAEFTTINLINAVAVGMDGMKYASDANLTAAGFTLIMNVVFGYIGIGSDHLFHGLPIATNDATVNQKMCEILVRCEVYAKEKGLTGSATGDLTLTRLKNYLGYTPTNMDGYYVASGTASYQNEQYLQINKSQSSGNQIYIWATNKIDFDNGKSFAIQKVSSGSATANACIAGNPLYSLQGAVYQIRKGSATGEVVETLTTDSQGKAVSQQKYPIGTKIFAKEITAPPGYKLNPNTLGPFTVTADGQNVFEVSDEPIFDPQVIKLTKTGSSSQKIQGAIFKAEFFASTSPSSQAQRSWYFASDSNGLVQFDDTHKNLAADAGYSTNDELFKPYGANGPVSFPLGCVRVTEIKAASGYILPSGSQGVAYIYIRQNTAGGDATAFWGDNNGNPVSKLGMYTITNDAVTAVNEEQGTMTMRKSLPAGYQTGELEGYCFNLYRSESGTLWYGRSDANGNIYKTNASHSEVAEANRVYTFTGLEDGTYSFRELLNGKNAKTTKVRIYTSGGITASFNHTYTGSELGFDTNGDCVIGNIALTGLNGGGNLTIEIENKPYVYGEPFELVKLDASDNDRLEGAIFKVEHYDVYYTNNTAPKKTWFFATDSNGYFTVDAAYLLDSSEYQSDDLYENGNIPFGLLIVTEEKAPAGFKKAEFAGIWRMEASASDQGVASCYWVAANGYTPTSGYGDSAYVLDAEPDKLYVKDAPIVELEIIKTSNGAISGIQFLVEKQNGSSWQNIRPGGGYYTTDSQGRILLGDAQVSAELEVGQVLRITEIVPEGTICTSENPKTITLAAGTNTVNFENVEISLNIIKTASDGNIAGIDFEVSKYVNNQWVLLGIYKTGSDGIIPVETEHLAVGAQFRIKEIVPVGYFCMGANPKTITLQEGQNRVSFRNIPLILEIIKTSTDGKIDGIDFLIDFKNDANEWDPIGTFTTGTDGKINVPQQYLKQGATYRITEIVPDNYICTSENPQIVTLNQATTTVSFSNKPFSGLEIVKTSPDNNVAGIQFTIEKAVQSGIFTNWEPLDPNTDVYVTDETGKIVIDDDTLLATGMTLRITENVPDNYICTENQKTITLQIGKNTVEFENIPIAKLSLLKRSDDGNVNGIQFKLERKHMTGQGGLTGRERWDLIGTYTTHDGGVILPEEFGILDVDGIYRVTEIVPQGYVCDNPVQTFTAVIGVNTVRFENRQAEGKISVHKEDAEGRAMQGAQFLLEYSLDNGASWEPIQPRTVKDPVAPGFCTSEGLNNGILTTGADGNIVFTGLALTELNKNVRYRLTEVKTQNGSSLMGISVFEGALSVADYELSYRVVNETAFQMPHTGDYGFAVIGIAFGFAILAALLILFNLPRKKEEKYN